MFRLDPKPETKPKRDIGYLHPGQSYLQDEIPQITREILAPHDAEFEELMSYNYVEVVSRISRPEMYSVTQNGWNELKRAVTDVGPPLRVNRLKIYESPLFAKNSEMEFKKLTLITGGSVGKTALCEWLAGFSCPKHLDRWIEFREANLLMELEFNSPEWRTTKISIPLTEESYRTSSFPVSPFQAIFPRTITFDEENQDDIEVVSDAMNIHRHDLENLCEDRSLRESGYIRKIFFERNDERCYLFANLQSIKANKPVCLRLLSATERYMLMIELGILAAKKWSETSPVFLILDSGFWKLETRWQKHYTELLASPAIKFQTVATTYLHTTASLDEPFWAKWSKVQLIGQPPNVEIRAVEQRR